MQGCQGFTFIFTIKMTEYIRPILGLDQKTCSSILPNSDFVAKAEAWRIHDGWLGRPRAQLRLMVGITLRLRHYVSLAITNWKVTGPT